MTGRGAPWGNETAKALENFGAASEGARHRVPRNLIRAYGEVKLAALEGIQEVESRFPEPVMEALRRAAAAVIGGDCDEAFPLPLAQGGAGTSLHMNLNEVLSRRVADELGDRAAPDPIEDLARFQSTNDTFATAAAVTAFRIAENAESAVIILQERLVARELEFDHLLMTGRTEMQDALPMRVGSLYGAWAGTVERDRWRLSKVAERVREVPLGGTALGSGFAAPRRYSHAAERHLRRITGLPLARSQNMMDGVGMKDGLAEVAGALKLAALNLARIAGDLLYYSSAPVAEFTLPNLQYGSSMMPLKTNPVLLERCRGLAMSAAAEADKVQLYAREGVMQLNAYLPFLLRALMNCADEHRTANGDLLRSLELMEPDAGRMESHLARSPALLNALMPLVGYRALKDLSESVAAEAPSSLEELALLVSRCTGIAIETVSSALETSRLTGPPKENP